MTAQQLKNSILQMAVSGKLVPQDPNDEPASVLLERIKAEKEELIKAGKIKRDKKSSEIFRGASRNIPYTFCEQIGKEIRDISDEIPFDIPESWEWVRLGQIGDTNIGLTYRPADKIISGGTLVLRSSNIQNDKMDYTDTVYVSCKIPERAMIHKGDILICARNGSRALVGKCAIVDKDGMAFGAFMAKFSSPFNEYIKLFIDSPIFRQQLEGVKTETINQITQDMLKNQLCPLPPLSEQHRIVAKIEELLPYIDKYERAETQLAELNSNFPELLKKSILQEAVQGKLVPQNPNDEPACVLLERIHAEKQALIKAGKIKKDKHESVIVTRDKIPYEIVDGKERCIADDVPFEIPDNWCWSKLGICLDVRDGTHDTPKYVSNGIPLITSKNLCNGKIDFSSAKFICYEDHYSISQRSKVDNGDIMFAMIGSIGNPVLYYGNEEFSIKNMALFKQVLHNKGVCMQYLYWFLFFSQVDMKKYASGGVQSFVSLNYLRNYYVPIPPLSEQYRIVTKIEEFMKLCEML